MHVPATGYTTSESNGILNIILSRSTCMLEFCCIASFRECRTAGCITAVIIARISNLSINTENCDKLKLAYPWRFHNDFWTGGKLCYATWSNSTRPERFMYHHTVTYVVQITWGCINSLCTETRQVPLLQRNAMSYLELKQAVNVSFLKMKSSIIANRAQA